MSNGSCIESTMKKQNNELQASLPVGSNPQNGLFLFMENEANSFVPVTKQENKMPHKSYLAREYRTCLGCTYPNHSTGIDLNSFGSY